MAKKIPWQYGKHNNPSNWHTTADILKQNKGSKNKSSGLMDRIAAIEQMLKDKK